MICLKTFINKSASDFGSYDLWCQFVNENESFGRSSSKIFDWVGKCAASELPSFHPYWRYKIVLEKEKYIPNRTVNNYWMDVSIRRNEMKIGVKEFVFNHEVKGHYHHYYFRNEKVYLAYRRYKNEKWQPYRSDMCSYTQSEGDRREFNLESERERFNNMIL